MSFISILMISLAVSMDSFAVSVCKGLAMKKMDWKKAIIIGLYFGFFQAFLPFIGFYLGSAFESFITSVDHWIAFILLALIGGNMIKDSFNKNDNSANDSIDFKTMSILGIATSIDALAVGITFAFLNVNLLEALLCIGFVSFTLSILGVKIGNKFGSKYKNKAEFMGGLILVFMGIKILIEHLNII